MSGKRITKFNTPVVIILMFIAHLFKKNNSYGILFSSALQEAINNTFKEMGYEPDKKKKNVSENSF